MLIGRSPYVDGHADQWGVCIGVDTSAAPYLGLKLAALYAADDQGCQETSAHNWGRLLYWRRQVAPEVLH